MDSAPRLPATRPEVAWVPRVLLSATEGGRAALVEELRSGGIAVLVAPPNGLVHEVQRGAVDLVLLHTDSQSAQQQLAELRQVSAVPVIVTLRSERSSAQRFFDAGADDCAFVGPARRELAVRVRAVLRRRTVAGPAEVITTGRFTLDLARHLFTVDGNPVHLPPKEFGLLALLMRRDGRVLGREHALELVWGTRESDDPTTVDVHVKRLRAKLEKDPAHPVHLLTVRGLGYRFQP